jgi:hypothetical protein
MRVAVRVPGPKAEVAIFQEPSLFQPTSLGWAAKLHDLKVAVRDWKEGRGEPFVSGTLRCPNGRCYRRVCSLWSPERVFAPVAVFANEAAEPLIRFEPPGRMSWGRELQEITIEASAVALADLPLLMLVNGYLEALKHHEPQSV